MKPSTQQTEGNLEILKYLESGEQTQITPEMDAIAKTIPGSAVEKCNKIIELISSKLRNENFNPDIFRKRTAEQIIRDGFITGCTDVVVVFVTAARACGLPAKYIESVDEKWLKSDDCDITGHQFSQVYDNETRKWVWVDPTWKKVDIPPPTGEGKVIFKEGLDSWDIGLTDGKSTETALYAFRDNWKNNQ